MRQFFLICRLNTRANPASAVLRARTNKQWRIRRCRCHHRRHRLPRHRQRVKNTGSPRLSCHLAVKVQWAGTGTQRRSERTCRRRISSQAFTLPSREGSYKLDTCCSSTSLHLSDHSVTLWGCPIQALEDFVFCSLQIARDCLRALCYARQSSFSVRSRFNHLQTACSSDKEEDLTASRLNDDTMPCFRVPTFWYGSIYLWLIGTILYPCFPYFSSF
jgi:hypothetical protein